MVHKYTLSSGATLKGLHSIIGPYFVMKNGVPALGSGTSPGGQSVAYLPLDGSWIGKDVRTSPPRAHAYATTIPIHRADVVVIEAGEVVLREAPLGSFVVTEEGSGVVMRFEDHNNRVLANIETGAISFVDEHRSVLAVTAGTVRGWFDDNVVLEYSLGRATSD
jgi:hypothetical protein